MYRSQKTVSWTYCLAQKDQEICGEKQRQNNLQVKSNSAVCIIFDIYIFIYMPRTVNGVMKIFMCDHVKVNEKLKY